jgi:hypothetical protein
MEPVRFMLAGTGAGLTGRANRRRVLNHHWWTRENRAGTERSTCDINRSGGHQRLVQVEVGAGCLLAADTTA